MSINILVVEDDDFFREAISGLLENIGYRITSARDGQVAKEKMIEEHFDIVLTDIQMPRMTGVELMLWSKEHRPTPFIIMTGFSTLIENQSAHELGAQEFLRKPFKNNDLLRAIDRIAGKVMKPQAL